MLTHQSGDAREGENESGCGQWGRPNFRRRCRSAEIRFSPKGRTREGQTIGEPVSVLEQFFQAIRVKLFNQLDNLGPKTCRCFLCVRHVEIDYAM
jgi:hypothetical protein